MLSIILDHAKLSNKNILILGSPRSGTHALGSSMWAQQKKIDNLQEICKLDGTPDYWKEVEKLYAHDNLKIAHIVQFLSKIYLSGQVTTIKQHCVVVNLRRRDKLYQFASWMYFHQTGGVNGAWHNHLTTDTKLAEKSITATPGDIEQFLSEQMLDDFFSPDYVVYYEDLTFQNSQINKNQYAFDLKNIFLNLEQVEHSLRNWKYHDPAK